MHGIIFHTLPDNIPWTLEEFLERTHDSCLKASRLFQSRNEVRFQGENRAWSSHNMRIIQHE